MLTAAGSISRCAEIRCVMHCARAAHPDGTGLYLSDLTFIEEGNADLVESGQVNFVKRKMVAEVIEEVRQYQQSPYNVMPIDAILTFIDSASIMDEKDRYEVSLKREPRAVRKTPTKV